LGGLLLVRVAEGLDGLVSRNLARLVTGAVEHPPIHDAVDVALACLPQFGDEALRARADRERARTARAVLAETIAAPFPAPDDLLVLASPEGVAGGGQPSRVAQLTHMLRQPDERLVCVEQPLGGPLDRLAGARARDQLGPHPLGDHDVVPMDACAQAQ